MSVGNSPEHVVRAWLEGSAEGAPAAERWHAAISRAQPQGGSPKRDLDLVLTVLSGEKRSCAGVEWGESNLVAAAGVV